jgi:hypothetical protein
MPTINWGVIQGAGAATNNRTPQFSVTNGSEMYDVVLVVWDVNALPSITSHSQDGSALSKVIHESGHL